MSFYEQIRYFERRKKIALARGDALDYTKSCSELGIPAEDPFLFERGLTEMFYEGRKMKEDPAVYSSKPKTLINRSPESLARSGAFD